MINQIVSLRGVDIGIYIIVGRTGGLASFPGPRPHFCHLQYGKSGEGLDNISCQWHQVGHKGRIVCGQTNHIYMCTEQSQLSECITGSHILAVAANG